MSMLSIQLSEEAYPALLAELSYVIIVKDRGIMLKIEGYNEKLPVRNIIVKNQLNMEQIVLGAN